MKKRLNSFFSSPSWAKMWDSMWWLGYISIIFMFLSLPSCTLYENKSVPNKIEVHFKDGTSTVLTFNGHDVRLNTDACIISGFDVLACNVTYFKKL